MRKLITIYVTCLLVFPFTGRSQSVPDYNESWNRPTICHASFDFEYVFFGKVPPRYREQGIDISSLPPIPGLKYRSYSTFCPKDTCFASRAVLAVRCPDDPILLRWASSRAAMFEDWCACGTFPQKPQRVLAVSSSADICNKYINRIHKVFNKQTCRNNEDHDCPNEQFAFLLTDCWSTEKYCTFYEASWYDWMSCGDTTAESYFSVNRETGQVATITDFVLEKDLPCLANLMMKYLKNYKGELWANPDFEWVPTDPLELLKAMNGCALIREGLIIYYHPYEIGAGADGQYNAVIPYDKLKSVLK